MLTLTDRYVARLIWWPLLGTLAVAAMLLTLDKMLRLFDFVVSEGGPVSVVWRMLANLLPEYLALAIPIGLFLGILLAFRKLALSSELDALRSAGISYGRLLRVPFLFAGALLLLNLFIVGFVQPKARYAYEGLRFELRSGALGASVRVGEFTSFGRRMTLRVEGSADGGRRLSGLFLHAGTRSGRELAVTAAEGTFLSSDDPDTIILRLRDGRLVNDQPGWASPRVLSFTRYDLPIALPRIENFRGRGDRNFELTIPELARVGKDPNASPADRNASRANFHFRLVEVVTILLVPLLAVALAVPPKRSSSALGLFLGIVMLVALHKVNQYAEDMGSLGRIDPAVALWTPFVLFAALVGYMFHVLAHRPGGQPIGALERAASVVGGWFKRLFRRRAGAVSA